MPGNVIGYEKHILEYDPDMIFWSEFVHNPIQDMKIRAHRSKKYLIIFAPFKALLQNKFIEFNKRIKPKGNFETSIRDVHGVFVAAKELKLYQDIFDDYNKPFFGMRLLPTVPESEKSPINPNYLMWLGMGWDKFRSSSDYQKFITNLSEVVPMKVYGSYNTFSYLTNKKVYDGYISPGADNFKAIKNSGIYLLTHSDMHIQESNPSIRLFEAVAAQAVIISDKHPFVIEHFGDNILYFDQNADANTKHAQVKKHVEWIINNPERARAMAAKAHDIFIKNFTLEKDLIRIAKMHEYVIKVESDKGLSFSWNY